MIFFFLQEVHKINIDPNISLNVEKLLNTFNTLHLRINNTYANKLSCVEIYIFILPLETGKHKQNIFMNNKKKKINIKYTMT